MKSKMYLVQLRVSGEYYSNLKFPLYLFKSRKKAETYCEHFNEEINVFNKKLDEFLVEHELISNKEIEKLVEGYECFSILNEYSSEDYSVWLIYGCYYDCEEVELYEE